MGIPRSRVAKYRAQVRFFMPLSVLYFLTGWRSRPVLKLKNYQLKLSNNSQKFFYLIFLPGQNFGI